jgi:hypothetical protein
MYLQYIDTFQDRVQWWNYAAKIVWTSWETTGFQKKDTAEWLFYNPSFPGYFQISKEMTVGSTSPQGKCDRESSWYS